MLQNGIEVPTDLVRKPRTDLLFPEIAFHHLTLIPSVIFLLGLTAATFATTDSALTANHFLLSIFWVWIKQKQEQAHCSKARHVTHLGFAFLCF
jgi:Na+/pantothenate symporter